MQSATSAARRFIHILLIASTTLLVASPADAQQARLAPEFTPDKAWNYDITLDLVVSQGPVTDDDPAEQAEQTRVNRVVQGARIRLVCIDVDENGGAELSAEFDRLTSLWTSPDGEQFEFSWQRENDPEIAEASSQHEGFATLCRSLAGAALRLRVTPDGRVRALDGLEQPMQVVAEGNEMSLTMLGLFTPSQLPETLSSIWRVGDDAPDSVGAGQGWQATRRTPMGPAGALDFIIDWSVDQVSEDTVRLTGSESVERLAPEAPDSAAPTMRLLQHAGEHSVVWNRRHGCIAERSLQRRMATEWRLADAAMRQTQTTNIRIVRRGSGD